MYVTIEEYTLLLLCTVFILYGDVMLCAIVQATILCVFYHTVAIKYMYQHTHVIP